MKVLYTTQGAVEKVGSHYYGDSINANYKRYMILGNEMTIACAEKEVATSNCAIFDDNVKFAIIHNTNSVKSFFRYNHSNIKIIKDAVKNADVLVVHLPHSMGYVAIHYAKKYKKPYMCVVCGCPWDALWNHGWRGKLLAPFAYIKLRKVISKAPYVVYVTKHFLQNRYPTNGRTIACSNVNVSTGIEEILNRRLSNIKERQQQKRCIRIGTSAAVDVVYKGQEYVIRAISKLKKGGKKFEYHIIGKGDPTRLKSIIAEEGVEDLVFIHGLLPHREVPGFLDDMDVYIQPSKQEGLPRAMIEAMSRGCLCMGSDVAGIPELIEKDFIFSKGDVNSIARKLERIDSTKLEKQAIRNFSEARGYDSNILNERRKNFLLEFMNNNTLR